MPDKRQQRLMRLGAAAFAAFRAGTTLDVDLTPDELAEVGDLLERDEEILAKLDALEGSS